MIDIREGGARPTFPRRRRPRLSPLFVTPRFGEEGEFASERRLGRRRNAFARPSGTGL